MNARKRNLLSRIKSDCRGASAIEFAIISNIFIVMIFGIINVGMMVYTKATLQWTVEDVIRAAAIDSTKTQTQLTTTLNNKLSALGLPAATVAYSVSTIDTIHVANLSASFVKSYTIPMVATYTITFSAATSMPQAS